MIDFKNSVTKQNLLRSFAGECQAWRRYQFAASIAKTQKLQVLYHLFNYTSEQEKEHAEIFYNHLREFNGQEIAIDGSYPIDNSQNLEELLRLASQHEMDEHTTVYKNFGDIAHDEGFATIAESFRMIAAIEKTHSERFSHYANLLKNNQLFKNDTPVAFLCLNCGHIHMATEAPKTCPVCSHDQGYFIRREYSPFEQ